jgi:hypothetical protein
MVSPEAAWPPASDITIDASSESDVTLAPTLGRYEGRRALVDGCTAVPLDFD